MSLKVKYIDVPVGAQEAAQVEGQGQPFADPQSVALGGKDIAYATTEPQGWLLDGNREMIPDEPNGFWWSEEASGEQGVFDKPPSLTFLFPSAYTATGLSFTFWPATNEWCSEIRITWYNGTSVLSQVVAKPDAPQWNIQHTVESFDKVQIELLRTNIPRHFAKVQKVEIGQVCWFDQDEIVSVSVVNEIDPLLSELTVDTMRIDIHDRRERALVPQKNQQMELYRNDKLYAVQYIASSSRQAKRYYSFSCQSAIGRLEDEYMGGIFNAEPVRQVLDDILDGFSYELHESFQSRTVTGYLPICTRREALQQLAFALGAVVSTQGSSTIRIIPIPVEVSASFTKSDIFCGSKVKTDPRIAKVEVVAHKFTPSAEAETLLDAETISGSDVLVTFADPHHSYAISGGTITGSGANWVTITADGEVTLTGKKYLHSTTRHTQRNPEATASERNNVYSVDEATLVHRGNVADVLKRLYAVSQFRQTLTQEAVITSQRAGQVVTSQNPWVEMLKGYITAMESSLTPTGHTASVTILGAKVLFDGFRYSGELYSGDMEAAPL